MSGSRWDADLGADGVRKVAARAVGWAFAAQAGRVGLQLLVLPILAALLDPAAFGLAAMVMVATGVVMSVADVGGRSALQRQASLTPALVAGVFWVNAGLGAACTLVTLALARPLALLYGEPRLTGLACAFAPLFLVGSLGHASLALLQRRLAQRRLSAIELGSAVLGSGAAIGAAWAGAGPYSLAIQLVGGAAALSAFALVLSPIPAWVRWSFRDVRPVVGYSVNLALFTAVNSLSRNADYFLLGRFAGSEVTGLYYMAYRLVVQPVSEVAGTVGRVALPALAPLRDSPDRLGSAYLKLAGAVTLLTFPATLGVLATRHEIVGVLGEEWAPAAMLAALLVPVGILQGLFGPLGTLYQVTGRTDLMLRVGGLSAVALVAALAVGTRWGATGVAAAYSLAFAVLAVPVLVVPLRLVGLRLSDLAREVARPLLIAAVMAGVVTAARPLAGRLPPVPALLALVALGVAVTAAGAFVFDRSRVRELAQLVARKR